MANLNEIADLSWLKNNPSGSDETAIPKEVYIRTAYNEFAYQSLLMAWKQKADDYYEVPSYLLTEVKKDVVKNEIDISDLHYFKSLPMEMWLQRIGEMDCECRYIKSTLNLSQLLCEDDSLPDDNRPYYAIGNKIKFPKGTHKNKLLITYANMGDTLSGYVEVDEAIASIIRDKLDAIYSGKVPQTDVTNNTNPSI